LHVQSLIEDVVELSIDMENLKDRAIALAQKDKLDYNNQQIIAKELDAIAAKAADLSFSIKR
jgi:hypothetical protein